MSEHDRMQEASDSRKEFARPDDEGGLRAPPGLSGWRKAWWWFDFIILVKLARLRFIAVLVLIGFVITQWDTLVAHYERWTRPQENQKQAAGQDIEWFCPMHPTVVRDNPREKCPICFMPLSKRKKGEQSDEPLPAGIVNRVQLSPYRVVLAGIHTWRVSYQSLQKELRTVGYVEFNERGQRQVSARVAGRIDKLIVSETGRMVKAGDELASLYSPELMVTVQNLLNAKKSNNVELVTAARKRLQLLGISDDQIDEVPSTGKANIHLTIRSPITGHVIKKYVREGQYVQEGTPLYDVVDLSTVWVQAQVYEEDLAFLNASHVHGDFATEDNGLAIAATTRAYPDTSFRGKLAFVYPHVDQDTRTVTVRFEVDNPPPYKLKPGTTAAVSVSVPPRLVPTFVDASQHAVIAPEKLKEGQLLAVPEGSVIDTGRQTIVYRQTSPGVYEGVKVDLGPRMEGRDDVTYYPVLRGLREGELVVSAGSFLVDAETRLNPAVGSIYFGGGSKSSPASGSSVRPSTPENYDAKVQDNLAQLSPVDRRAAEEQQFCVVLPESRLGSMGVPVKLTIEGQSVFLCCSGCKKQALAKPDEALEKLKQLKRARSKTTAPVQSAAAGPMNNAPSAPSLSEDDRRAIAEQAFCAVVTENRLGSMGMPVKIVLEGQPVFLCCEGCREEANANPKATLASAAKLKKASKEPHRHD